MNASKGGDVESNMHDADCGSHEITKRFQSLWYCTATGSIVATTSQLNFDDACWVVGRVGRMALKRYKGK